MRRNPFDMQLENAKTRASELRSDLKRIVSEIEWYESTELKALADSYNELQIMSQTQLQNCTKLRGEAHEINAAINLLSESVNSLWNPMNWFDSKQRELRGRVTEKKISLEAVRKKISTLQREFEDIEHKMQTKTQEIEIYKGFDLDAKRKDCSILTSQLSQQEREVERIADRKKQMDVALDPIVKQINEAVRKKSEATSDAYQAQKLDEELSDADNSYERAMVHQECEKKFGTGNPKKVISQKESEIRRLERDLEKLEKRAKTIADNAERNIRKLILDGNNLCYQGDVFIGLAALKSLAPILANDYEVVMVFDASIRRALGSGDSDIRKILGGDIQVHVVATSVKADETVLDLAGTDNTNYVISNDRFAEFGEKPALRDQRIIRHEIVSGQVLIQDLGVSANFSH